jgi:hypothetical protein
MDALTNRLQDELRAKIVGLEAAIKAQPDQQIEIDIKHHFAPGLYLREMLMPKNSVVVGKIHKTEHLCILSKGKVIVVNENGRQLLEAPAVVHSVPGVKRALHALEETVWVNCHHNPTDERDLEKIDDVFVVDTFDQFLSFTEQKKLEGSK